MRTGSTLDRFTIRGFTNDKSAELIVNMSADEREGFY